MGTDRPGNGDFAGSFDNDERSGGKEDFGEGVAFFECRFIARR